MDTLNTKNILIFNATKSSLIVRVAIIITLRLYGANTNLKLQR